jgi:hypothetical protein
MMIYESCQNLHETWSNLQPIQSGQDLLKDPELFKGPINKIGEPTVVLLRKEIFDSIGYFDPDFSHLGDVEMWLRVIGHYKIGFIDKSLSAFRVHPKQQTIQNIESGLVNLDPYRLYSKILYSPAYSFADYSFKQQIISQIDRQINGSLQELRSVSQILQQTQSQLEQTQSQLEQTQSQLEQKLEQANDRIKAMESSKFWQLRKAWFRLKSVMGIKSNEYSNF